MHGGLSPVLERIDQLRYLERPTENPANPSITLDLLWADPDVWNRGWNVNARGASFTFGPDIIARMCAQLDIDFICRAHQVSSLVCYFVLIAILFRWSKMAMNSPPIANSSRSSLRLITTRSLTTPVQPCPSTKTCRSNSTSSSQAMMFNRAHSSRIKK